VERTLLDNLRRGTPLENRAADEIERLRGVVGWTAEERELDRALCEFCNTVEDLDEGDEPIQSDDIRGWKIFTDLCAAYNKWYEAKGQRPPQ
jgi:hypothetical protein